MMFYRILCLALVLSSGVSDLMAQVSCDEGYVRFEDHAINVKPTGLDDTQNLQCALDHAIANDYPLVRLDRAEYFISSVIAEGFIGTLSGMSKATTMITVINDSIDCQAMIDEGRAPSAIKFSGGEPRIRNMSLSTDTACIDEDIGFYLLHFTGPADQASDCENSVIFGTVDRVNIQGTGVHSPASTAVSALGEGSYFGGCQTTLLGTFKLNRSEIMGYTYGVATILHASAQVDINFNQFEDNRFDVIIPNANQSTTITGNSFVGVANDGGLYKSIQVLTTDPTAPDFNRVVVHRNTFDIQASAPGEGSAIVFSQTAKTAQLSTIASENTIRLMGDAAYGIVAGGVSGSIVNKNRFAGSAVTGIYANMPDSPASSDWAILANTGFKNLVSQGPDIILGPDLSNSVVGAKQTDRVQDLGIENSVLPIESDQALEERVAALEAMVATLTEELATHTASVSAHHEQYTDTDAVEAVGPHFSGSHDDLADVNGGQHHADVLSGVTRDIDPNTGHDTITFSDMNVQIVSGSGATDGATTGTGNLIIGYNELRTFFDDVNDRNGSHMLVVGQSNNYTADSFGGMVVGVRNETTAAFASVSGGLGNQATGNYSSVTGGQANEASGDSSSVSGGQRNTASGNYTSVSGGASKEAATDTCTVGDNGFDC